MLRPQILTSLKIPLAVIAVFSDLPEGWTENRRRVFLSFEGVDSSFLLLGEWSRVGYSQDSRLPAEFDITDALCLGKI